MRPFYNKIELFVGKSGRNYYVMRRAIGFLIVLFGLSHYFNQSFGSFDEAMSQSFQTIETAALVTEAKLLIEK